MQLHFVCLKRKKQNENLREISIFRKKGFSSRDSARKEHPMSDFTHGTSETEMTEQSMKITSCTHLNGHHSIRQSCPKTRMFLKIKLEYSNNIIEI